MTTSFPWKNPDLSLGERCLRLAEAELASGVRANPFGQPNTGPRVREYLAGCVRDVSGAPRRLGLVEGNWCAAFQGWLLEQCLLEGERRPHAWRAGVVEMEADAKALGLWRDRSEFLAGKWSPNIGDLIIWDRSDPKDPSTSWHRHVNRLVAWTSPEWDTMITLGGNESRTILRQQYLGGSVRHPRLLGFVSYYQRPTVVEIPATERERLLALTAAAFDEILKGAA